ncbi:citramalyl-CoA lyase, mitochondrial-like [Ruditapes philippinarum]|uniref:citramalyl-CoA lyase, mitochondrial-like n=1 Tax=Ruditapes philippinarum TaxID=129788 RepID=UPI00295B1197|nr:citramalyl-CoA lyase, mitochondrial-like [Ruditapes philippinarum]
MNIARTFLTFSARRVLQSKCATCLAVQKCQVSTGSSCCQNDAKKLKIKRFTPRRAVLYIPGSDERKLQKIQILDVDCAVMDCEDGVAANRKVRDKHTITKQMDTIFFPYRVCGVRVNAVSSGLMEEDLRVIFQAQHLPQTIMVPKVNSVQELASITNNLQNALKDRTVQHKISLVLFVESALGLINLRDICERGVELSLRSNIYNVDGLVFGSDDFCADIGAKRSAEGSELLYARQKFVTIAKAFRLQAIDMVHIDYKDQVTLKEQSIKSAGMGFTGKQVIHPSQVPIVQEAFSPSEEHIDWAKGLIKAFEDHQTSGTGAFTYRGHMIDMPLLLQAKNVVQLAEAIHAVRRSL